ncbi:carboxylesterase family protein [Teredinibacter waterburyi]|uniref:carboxylesterase family protein n=1 Tax=Teredinibacter waterburyi TaxID=1500538 RepID=UPI00165ED2DA|nr:carboxylesterase family protein [Teredinibacter waterburyi]
MPNKLFKGKRALFIFGPLLFTFILALVYVTLKVNVLLHIPAEIEGLQVDDRTLVHTDLGKLQGFAVDEYGYAWLGIKYATASRWTAPKSIDSWQGVKQNLKAGQRCPQLNPTDHRFGLPENERGKAVGSEDCLYLNIHVPKKANLNTEQQNTAQQSGRADLSKLPVMVFFHFGGNSVGWGSRIDFSKFASEMNVVVVSMNYRLGMFGLFYHPKINDDKADISSQSGNYGTLDMVEGLKWVHQHISNFGGDENNVVIFGGSSGAKSVMTLTMTPLAKGLFHKAIAMSGLTNGISPQVATNFIDAEPNGIEYSSSEIISRLLIADRKQKLETLSRAQSKLLLKSMSSEDLAKFLNSLSPEDILAIATPDEYGKYSDSYFINDGFVFSKEAFFESIQHSPRVNPVPMIVGTTRDETKLFQLMEPDEFLETRMFGLKVQPIDQTYYDVAAEYRTKALYTLPAHEYSRYVSSNDNAPIFQYRFDWDEHPSDFFVKNMILDLKRTVGASHVMDVPFFLNEFQPNSISFPLIFVGKHDTASRDKLSQDFQSYIKSFIQYGDPASGLNDNLVVWNAWSNKENEDKYLIFDTVAGGGIRPSTKEETKKDLIQKLYAESRVSTDKICRIFSRIRNEEMKYSAKDHFSDYPEFYAILNKCSDTDI